jgi:hypothetical protein
MFLRSQLQEYTFVVFYQLSNGRRGDDTKTICLLTAVDFCYRLPVHVFHVR